MRSDAGYFREEPGAGKPHARICEGEAEWPSYSTTTAARAEWELRLFPNSPTNIRAKRSEQSLASDSAIPLMGY